MTSLHTSLSQIAKSYTVFEKDQILTEEQLNSVSQYLDDQDRMTRVYLTGVGIVCGLQVNIRGKNAVLKQGIGITTDGDLIHVQENEKTFDRFKEYSAEAPAYAPFFNGSENRMVLFELVEANASDELAKPLGSFSGPNNADLTDMTALLLVESYVKDRDLCEATDCDNHGQSYISNLKLLLVSRADADKLTSTVATVKSAARKLQPVWADRVAIRPSLDTQAEWDSAFLKACQVTQSRLTNAIASLWPTCGFLFSNQFDSDPTSGWLNTLNRWANHFSSNTFAVQYYHSFLCDLVISWNELLEVLNTDESWACFPGHDFAKHVLLGDLSNIATTNRRTLFYPAKQHLSNGKLNEAEFLVRKLGALIESFHLPDNNGITVTPSSQYGNLQDKAIPFYYKAATGNPLPDLWHFQRNQQQRAAFNYGYHAAKYDAQGAALSPLNANLHGFDFFRVEGHIGKEYESAINVIEKQIVEHNLPFSVQGVLLEGGFTKLRRKRGAGFTDLHRFHKLARTDLSYRIEDVKSDSITFKAALDAAVVDKTISNDATGGDQNTVTKLADKNHKNINTNATLAIAQLNKSYADFKQDKAWMSSVEIIKNTAGRFKTDFTNVISTPVVSSFDGMIVETMPNWIEWLDVLIEDKDKKEDEKNLFSKFIKIHPGVESACGVARGGTLVLLYNSSGIVVGDLMLAYHVAPPEEEASEPVLERPIPPVIIEKFPSIKITAPLNHILKEQWKIYEAEYDRKVNIKLDSQVLYNDAFKESLGIVKDIYLAEARTVVNQADVTLDDGYLGVMDSAIRSKETHIRNLEAQLAGNISETQRTNIIRAKEEAQQQLAKEISDVGLLTRSK